MGAKSIISQHKISLKKGEEILYNGQNIMETGLETKPGQEIKDVIVVIGAS